MRQDRFAIFLATEYYCGVSYLDQDIWRLVLPFKDIVCLVVVWMVRWYWSMALMRGGRITGIRVWSSATPSISAKGQ